MLLHHFFQDTTRRQPDRIALACEGARLSWADIAGEADRLARCLHARGVRRGDRVALFLDNGWESVAGIHAVLSLGAVAGVNIAGTANQTVVLASGATLTAIYNLSLIHI